MTDSSDEDHDGDYILYKDRPEWSDITPMEQNDGPEPVVAIAYTSTFKDAHNYLRAVIHSGEKSERALELTRTCISMNAANYSAWQYRRDILKALGKDLKEELTFLEEHILKSNYKNYQVWHHRKALVELLQDASGEKAVLDTVLKRDAKNYHAWQHRQWVVKTFNLFTGELNYVDRLLCEDVRNNSAWNYRYFVISNTTGFTQSVVDDEIQYTLESIKMVPENESSWNYLRGVLLNDSRNQKVIRFCEDMYSSNQKTRFLLALIVDFCYDQVVRQQRTSTCDDSMHNVSRAKSLCNELATQVDTIRANYWRHLSTVIEQMATTGGVNNTASGSNS